MSYTEQTVTFKTTPDFELGMANHHRETDYFLVMPDKPAEALVIYIPGFGEDATGDYVKTFCRKVAKKYNIATATVYYHCCESRILSSENIYYETEDVEYIKEFMKSFKLPFDENLTANNLEKLNTFLAKHDKKMNINATLIPGKNEYQNGGILQALDIINATEHAISNNNIPHQNVILVGSSYGGYIANMATKLAPQTFKAVFDNSSWAHPNLLYIVGRHFNKAEVSKQTHSNIITQLFLRSAWTLKPGLPNTLNNNRYEIRAFSEKQIIEMVQNGLQTFYYFVHAQNDLIANTKDKIAMASFLIQHGIKVHMEVMSKEDVDGRYVKELKHGMGLSLLTLFDKGYKEIAEHSITNKNDFDRKSKIIYPVEEFQYVFDYSVFPVKAYTEGF